MSKQINIEELKALIANRIRQENLHEALPDDAIERIKNKILNFNKKETAKDIPSLVSETDVITHPVGGNAGDNFPNASQITPSPKQQVNMTGNTDTFFVDKGSAPTGELSNPTMGYTPELPEMLKKAEPSELFVFQYNDINDNAENLSYKPFRLMNDPDIKKSMNNLWVEQGKTKADVYVAKFEKIGEINFNYTNGTSKFTEKTSELDYETNQIYKENPYTTASLPQIDNTTQRELETYIKNSIDLEKVVHDIVIKIVKDSLLTNTEKIENVSEDIHDYGENKENNGYSIAQSVKPMEESIVHDDEEIEFNLTMKDMVENNSYQKIVLPKELNEKINSGDNSMMIKENKEIKIWKFLGKIYYTPVDRISKDKGYIKN